MGRTSSIDKLPKEVLDQFKAWVEDGNVNLDQVCERVNEQLTEMGLESLTVSRSAVGRKAKSHNDEMLRIGEEMRQAKASTKLFYEQFGEDLSDGGKFLAETLQAFILKLNIALHKFDDDEMSIGQVFEYSKIVKNLTGAISQLELALSRYVDREAEILALERERAKAKLDEMARTEQSSKGNGSLNLETIRKIREEVYGIYE